MGCSMQGIIPIILQRTKSASDSIISSPVYQGDGALVISARMFHSGEIFVTSSRVYQVGDTSHLGTGVSRRKVARSHCQMPAIPLLLFPHHLRYPSHSNITFSRIFPAFEHYFFPRPPSLVYQTTHILRQSYLNVCDRRLTNVSSLRMGCPSASLPIGDRGPASHSLRCRRNVSQCSVPTNITIYPYSPLLWAMNTHRLHGEKATG